MGLAGVTDLDIEMSNYAPVREKFTFFGIILIIFCLCTFTNEQRMMTMFRAAHVGVQLVMVLVD